MGARPGGAGFLGLTLVLLIVAGTGDPARAFRFVCNSVDAQGVPSGDICGTCNAEVAARWPGGAVHWRLHPQGQPNTLTPGQLEDAAVEAVGLWSQVQGCWLEATAAPAVGEPGSWGGNDLQQDVIWVQGEPSQWQELTFTNPATTIALAAVRYRCQGAFRDSREIFDADIALNNTGLPWSCAQADCWSVEHAMLHEIGHGIGLGHGCGQCTTSVMAALADPSYQPTELTDDDEAGCVALYPDPPNPEPVETGPEAGETDGGDGASLDGSADAVDATLPQPRDCDCASSPDAAAASWLLALCVGLWLGRRRRIPQPR